jgi:hypothetical protein
MSMRCNKCGKFISYKDIETAEVIVLFTPDTPFSVEGWEYKHVQCNVPRRLRGGGVLNSHPLKSCK